MHRPFWAKSRTEADDAADAVGRPPALNMALPAESINRAHAAFENFSLSASRPARPVVSRTAGRAGVYAAHRHVMSQALDTMRTPRLSGGGMTLALSASDAERLVQSVGSDTAVAELADVLAVARRHIRGAEFYVGGNPVVNRLALRARASGLLAQIERTAPPDPAKPSPTLHEQ